MPYRQTGSLVVGFGPRDEAALAALLERGRANGVEGLALLSGEEARDKEPHLSSQVTAALWAPTAAICSPWEYCLALAETAVVNGVELLLDTRVTGLAPVEGGWRAETSRGALDARFVVSAAGVSAARIRAMAAPAAYEIRPTRGQYYLLDKSEGDRVSHVIFQCPGPQGKGVLTAPTVHGNLIVGPNAEPVEGEDTGTTAQGLDFVRTAALRSVPSIRFGENIRNFAGVRAVSDRSDFILDWAAPGLLELAGICSPGLTAAPAIAEYAAGLLARAGLDLTPDASDFRWAPRPVPFRSLTPEERARRVEADPAWGRVLCRCETVTEGEILSALRTPIPPRSVDGVKRRVGAGMGRCQGGFCGPRVVELLARKLGVSPCEIPQDKAGSWLLAGETKGGTEHV